MRKSWCFLLLVVMLMVGCAQNQSDEGHDELSLPEFAPAELNSGERLRVVASTSIVGDVVANVGREAIDLTVLMPLGVDPHAFEPTPQDVATLTDAHVIFVNGGGLEESLESMLESDDLTGKVARLISNLELVDFGEAAQGNEHDENEHGGGDPHVWTDPNQVMIWLETTEQVLSALDPAGKEAYAANAKGYRDELVALDSWIQEQVAQIPETERQLVTDHRIFGYFAQRYGFEQTGTIIPGYSTLAEPSAKELAELIEIIQDLGVETVFVGNSVNQNLAETVAQDTGTRLVFVYTGSLGTDEAETYLAYMRYNVDAFVGSLK